MWAADEAADQHLIQIIEESLKLALGVYIIHIL